MTRKTGPVTDVDTLRRVCATIAVMRARHTSRDARAALDDLRAVLRVIIAGQDAKGPEVDFVLGLRHDPPDPPPPPGATPEAPTGRVKYRKRGATPKGVPTRRATAILDAWAANVPLPDIARRFRTSEGAIKTLVCVWRRKGDPRAVRSIIRKEGSPAP